MPAPLLANKLHNRIKALDGTVEISLRNVRVNGESLGCSGFIVDPKTNAHVYIDTDNNHGTNTKALYRRAKHAKDYTGGMNHFTSYDQVAEDALALLKKGTS